MPSRWDRYFHSICESVASNSPCLSRKIGAILVRDGRVVATGYNGPPVGVPHCEGESCPRKKIVYTRNLNEAEQKVAEQIINGSPGDVVRLPNKSLLNKIQYVRSGELLDWCPALHAEQNCINTAAYLGVITKGCTLYLNSIIPCFNCFKSLINSGIVEVVCNELVYYSPQTEFLVSNSHITLRTFELEKEPTHGREGLLPLSSTPDCGD